MTGKSHHLIGNVAGGWGGLPLGRICVYNRGRSAQAGRVAVGFCRLGQWGNNPGQPEVGRRKLPA